VLLATVLEAAMASIDATVVGIALPAIGRDFGASLTVLQWVVPRTPTLAGLLLFAGTLRPVRPEADLPDRRRMVRAGLAPVRTHPDRGGPYRARAVQAVGAALLTPSRSSVNTSRATPAKAWTPWPEPVTSEVAPLVSGSPPGPATASGPTARRTWYVCR
jgi:hypothetical protein